MKFIFLFLSLASTMCRSTLAKIPVHLVDLESIIENTAAEADIEHRASPYVFADRFQREISVPILFPSFSMRDLMDHFFVQ